MKIETVTCKGVSECNEDAVIINDNISVYGVADGACDSFLDDFAKINMQLQTKMKEYSIDTSKKEQLWGTALALVKISPNRIDFIQTGDCMIFAVYDSGFVRVLTRAQTEFLEGVAINKWKELIDKGIHKQKDLREGVEDVLISIRQRSNTFAGYGVLNGENDAVDY
ncbi:hypothetical protein [Virgibacillus chiguensis]|uniref:Serine/threonine protein phosphatase PrpC n=1 Tax=Virgibacillus chiguensis TaxID=411959 RepID=A0A1M5XLF0_9BACI|nr:hypothetical protein [Virgibacillus chiguensis]SHI00378.1 hypothetical protein SAMN05421807_12912 [Virgibacillus chiguensis]